MYARINFVFCEPAKVDDGVAHLEAVDRPAVEALPGNAGLTTVVDREAGVIAAISYWDEPLHSSEASLTEAREAAAKAAGGDVVTETFEVAVDWRATVPAPGTTVRMARLQIELARLPYLVDFYRDEVVQGWEGCAGLCRAQLLIDRDSGNGVSLTAWENDAVAADADSVLHRLGEQVIDRLGVKFPRVEVYQVVGVAAATD